MKKLLIFFLLCNAAVFAQEKLSATHQFTISGKVKKESVITIDSLQQYTPANIGDIKVTNHLGEFKHKDEKLKGILLKDILSHTIISTSGPKYLSTIYFICTGVDGYKVVYSWNELFNTEVGNHVYIIMEKNGINAAQMPESIQMTSTMDFKTGRRYLHNLKRIEVRQAE
ncbi:hypothetical protein BH09BAC6_BH09BAC6_33680 [soil metagenome]|jgi:hypothetical protein